MYRNTADRQKIERILCYSFKDEKYLQQALTRPSAINEGLQKSHVGNFQRLEFIGDKVLNLIVSDIVFDNHPHWGEGQLTTEVSKHVNNNGPLLKIAQHLNLGDFLIMGEGEEKINQGRQNTKILSDAFEALIGAIWIDSGKDSNLLRNFLLKQFRALGLSDYNQDYESATIVMGFRSLADNIKSLVTPEIYEVEGGAGNVGLNELLALQEKKAKATKPLAGLAAFFEQNTLSYSSPHEEVEENDDITNNQTIKTEENNDRQTNSAKPRSGFSSSSSLFITSQKKRKNEAFIDKPDATNTKPLRSNTSSLTAQHLLFSTSKAEQAYSFNEKATQEENNNSLFSTTCHEKSNTNPSNDYDFL